MLLLSIAVLPVLIGTGGSPYDGGGPTLNGCKRGPSRGGAKLIFTPEGIIILSGRKFGSLSSVVVVVIVVVVLGKGTRTACGILRTRKFFTFKPVVSNFDSERIFFPESAGSVEIALRSPKRNHSWLDIACFLSSNFFKRSLSHVFNSCG